MQNTLILLSTTITLFWCTFCISAPTFLKPHMEMFKSRAYYKWQFTMFSTVFPHMVQYLTMSILVYM